MKSLILGILPSLIFVLFVFVSVHTLVMWAKFKTRGRRNPLTSNLLRSPGQSIYQQIQELSSDINFNLLTIPLFPVAIYALMLTQIHYAGIKESLSLWLTYGLMALSASGYLFFKTAKLMTRRNRLRLGLDGEMAVGQELNQLMLNGFRVFHDFPAEKFNIDHIVVGSTGVFAVETKGRSKPVKGRGKLDATVTYEGDLLKFPSWTEVEPLKQSKKNSAWLQKWLTSAIGESVHVTPVLALPGWFVERPKPGIVRVYNGKFPQFLTKIYVGPTLSDELIQRITHQLDQRCRDVEPTGYQKQ